MCGRFAFARSRTQIRQNVAEDLGHDVDEWVDEDNFYPRYNVAPRTYSPVLRSRDSSPSSSSSGESEAGDAATAAGTSQRTTQSNEPHFILHSMRWGVIPHWSKEDSYQMNTINARAENLLEGGGMWASLKGSKRCIVPCEGYYEWLTKLPKTKLPHFLKHKNNHLMYFAGLWDSVHLPNSSAPLYTFSIITTSAPSAYAWLHDRQPVILSSPKEIETWLNPKLGWVSELARLLEPYKGEELDCYQVPQEVGKVGNESPAFVQPIAERKDGIEAMFKKQVKAKKAAKEEKQATNIEVGDNQARKVKKEEEHEGSSATPSRVKAEATSLRVKDETRSPAVKQGTKSLATRQETKSPLKRKRSSSPTLTSQGSQPAPSTPSKKAKTSAAGSSLLPKKGKGTPAKEKKKITAFFKKK